MLASVAVGLCAAVAVAAPVAPVVSGPTAIQFAYHPAGFRAALAWEPVPTAVEYRIYHAETLYYVGSVTGTSCVVYGMQGVEYHHYVVAVDSSGATSTPSNTVDIMTSAPVPPTVPATFTVLPTAVFGVQSASAGATEVPVKIPYNPAEVVGDASALRMMHYVDGTWTDVTTSVDTTRSFVTGMALPTSVFAVVNVNESITPTIVTIPTDTTLVGANAIRRRQATVLVGSVSPVASPGTVTVLKYRLVAGVWVAAGTTDVPVVDGQFHYRFSAISKGSWMLRAIYAGSTEGYTVYAPSASDTKRITVR